MNPESLPSFSDLALAPELQRVIDEVGYESPSPIQARSIPPLLEGRDLLGQAQTGTGKTAAFALPLLSRLDPALRAPQLLVLTPTRELALQVAEAVRTYARHLPGFHVLPVYGGQNMGQQLKQLARGVQAVVGTPGRIQDHLRRGTLRLDRLAAVVVDEADEMLKMGFIDEVESILEQAPAERQVALFSATMPEAVLRVARRHLRDPVEIRVRSRTATVETIEQRFWQVKGLHKLDALTRILEAEEIDAMIVFVRTKTSATELAEKLEARGFSSAPLNGDMSQAAREETVERLRGGALDIVVATDVAARGLDVPRISHVVNYDIPYDPESYVHRIGRTGRAGRVGKAILFVAPREKRMLAAIEQATRQPITAMTLPSRRQIADLRVGRFKERLTQVMESEELEFFEELIDEFQAEQNAGLRRIAGALAFLAQGEKPLRAEGLPADLPPEPVVQASGADHRGSERLQRYRIEVGAAHGVEPGNIVGAISNEARLAGRDIGRIEIHDEFSLVELPPQMPEEIFRHLQGVRVCGRPLRISPDTGPSEPRRARPGKGRGPAPDGKKRPFRPGPRKSVPARRRPKG